MRAHVPTAAMPEASEVGSRTLSRFRAESEEIYLVIRDHKIIIEKRCAARKPDELDLTSERN